MNFEIFTHQVQKNLRKVLYGLGSMGCKLLFPRLLNITRGDLWPLTPAPLPDGEREG